LSSFFAWPGGGAPVEGFALSSFFAWPGGSVLDGVVLGVVLEEPAPPDVLDGVVVLGVDGVAFAEDAAPGVPVEVAALDVEPVFSPGGDDVVVEVVLVPLPDPELGVAGPLDDVELAAQPVTNRARTMG
jgi:hypothetical protein